MPLNPGTKLGPYEILSPIGRGGMGEVYRARDTRLKRDVALKVLPDEFAQDPERIARFTREAEVLASLNHPNIAAIYGVEDRALAMELVDGESPKGPLPFEEAWKIASQIADALEYAHEKGVIHRDLKPANIKVTHDGVVKLLDFGLAKAFTETPESRSGDLANSPTVTLGATVAGTILGTAAYMAPEQAKGKRVDKRADIWSFGVVLYELLTGERLFKGDDAADTLAQVLTKESDFVRVPTQARRLIRECLQKDPKQRLRDIGATRYLLEHSVKTKTRTPRLTLVVAGVALAGIAAAAGLALVHFREKPPLELPVHFKVDVPEGTNFAASNVSLSPDGRFLAFGLQEKDSISRIWVRPLGSSVASRIENTEGAVSPFWSPDSQFIAFFANDKLKRVPAAGGPAVTICSATRGTGTWGPDDVILFSVSQTGPINRVSAKGGLPTPVTTIDKTAGEGFHAGPQFLPDGQQFIYLAGGGEKPGIYAQTLGTNQRKFLLATDGQAQFSAPNHFLFVREGTLVVQNFDPHSLVFSGEPKTVTENVSLNRIGGRANFAVSNNGVLAIGARIFGDAQLIWYDRLGRRVGTALPTGSFFQIELSPDDKRVAVERIESRNTDLWMLELANGVFSRLTFSPDEDERDPVWSGDSHALAYNINNRGKHEVRQLTLGSATSTVLYSDGGDNRLDDWSKDGGTIIYHPLGGRAFFELPLSGGELKGRRVFETPFLADEARLSPDGKWIAYDSNASGQFEVYVATFPAFSERQQVSTGSGVQPRWRKDGKELFFLTIDGKVMAVEVMTGPRFQASIPKALFQTSVPAPFGTHSYSATADGQLFLVREPVGDEQIDVMVHWPAMVGK